MSLRDYQQEMKLRLFEEWELHRSVMVQMPTGTGVTPRRVNYYCAGGRIPGAVKMATIWLIPKDAEKPVDMRTRQGKSLK